jgi:hypothetical protein
LLFGFTASLEMLRQEFRLEGISFEAVYRTMAQECKEPIDKIYAVLGLLKPSFQSRIQIDYFRQEHNTGANTLNSFICCCRITKDGKSCFGLGGSLLIKAHKFLLGAPTLTNLQSDFLLTWIGALQECLRQATGLWIAVLRAALDLRFGRVLA